MSAHTKTHPTKRRRKAKGHFIPWREVYKKEISAYSEGGLILRGSRHKAEITQKELADALGISQHHVSEMENGKRPIGKEMAKRLAHFFKTDYRIFL
ncbi:MAG TPA: helix-turn-helix transcriptional regulator [Chlamydiales bacterium]|nr:helix-turn-helix transcriptional regulator [Chlamydiales bacterium]